MVYEPIKPSTYIHIVCNMTAKDYLPKDLPTFITLRNGVTELYVGEPLSPDLEEFFFEEGFEKTDGLTQKQGLKLQKLVVERKKMKPEMATPRQIGYLAKSEPYKKLKQADKFICLGSLTKDLADIMIKTIQL